MQKNQGKVACIFGASGFVGSNLIRPMTLNNWRILAVTRSPYLNNSLKMFGPPGSIDLEKIFLFDEQEIRNLLKVSDVVINAVGILNSKKKIVLNLYT